MNLTKANDQISLICRRGALNLSAIANFEEDAAAMLDSLYELFQERGDKVTSTLVADRMESKIDRHISRNRAAYLYRLLGFYSRCGQGHDDGSKYYIIPDFDLLALLRMKYCKMDPNEK
jgi:hypothetical protein